MLIAVYLGQVVTCSVVSKENFRFEKEKTEQRIQGSSETPRSADANWSDQRVSCGLTSNTVNGQLERIRIPVFDGNKMDFPRWHAAFSSCVDQSSLSSQFKMLRLEGCLTGEGAETIKGLGYSEAAYGTAKGRLLRKYGGDRRQVQGHLEELKKVKAVREDDAKSLEKFAAVLERAVVNLKENDRQSDFHLKDGTLYTIVQRYQKHCYRNITGG